MIKLKEVRKAKGLTQAQLAAKVRHADPTADQTTISVLERGNFTRARSSVTHYAKPWTAPRRSFTTASRPSSCRQRTNNSPRRP